MKNHSLLLSFLLLLATFVAITAQDTKLQYSNPIIPGFNPDPSICRAGNDFYLVTSTFEYFPGVPVYHSKDLVNWEMIGHVLSRPSQLNLDSMDCSGGIYAPTIRYNKGIFYMITTLANVKIKGVPRGNFICTATNPAGPWSEPHWIANASGIDPDLFFDDNGKVYYTGNTKPKTQVYPAHRNIWIQELDIQNWKLIGERAEVLDGSEYYKKGTLDGGIESGLNNYESPHLYKKDGKYYVMIAHGGTGQNHAVSIWKSDKVFGPYELNPANPILTHRDLPRENAITTTGHADLVETQNGEWWMVFLGKRPYGGVNHILGRETFMAPVDWSGTWPVVNPKGKIGRTELTHTRPNLKEFVPVQLPAKDEFEGKELRKEWTFIRTPRTEWWSLSQKKGFLSIQLRPETINEALNPSFIGKRQEHKNFSATASMQFTPQKEGEEAGLVVERDKDYYFKFTLATKNNKTGILLIKNAMLDNKELSFKEIVPIHNKSVFLKINAEGVFYTFKYSVDGKNWSSVSENVDGRFLGIDAAGRFTGTMLGMYTSSNGVVSKNYANFDWFEYFGK
ncbi:MAG: glycoside hydrolase family 43 protein [Paludibacter sp.]|nr:glycoside hydrolase family 43 protein [Paludibacter sp.]